MRPWHTVTALLAAVAATAGQPVAVSPQAPPAEPINAESLLPPGRAPFGLSCGECSLAADAACSALWISPVVVEARGAQVRSANRQCYKLPRADGSGATETCDIVESVTFEQLRYFRSPSEPPDRFRVIHSIGDDVQAADAGIVLSPDRRYVLFATVPNDGSFVVAAACPIGEARVLE
jgi:hypothetical protein